MLKKQKWLKQMRRTLLLLFVLLSSVQVPWIGSWMESSVSVKADFIRDYDEDDLDWQQVAMCAREISINTVNTYTIASSDDGDDMDYNDDMDEEMMSGEEAGYFKFTLPKATRVTVGGYLLTGYDENEWTCTELFLYKVNGNQFVEMNGSAMISTERFIHESFDCTAGTYYLIAYNLSVEESKYEIGVYDSNYCVGKTHKNRVSNKVVQYSKKLLVSDYICEYCEVTTSSSKSHNFVIDLEYPVFDGERYYTSRNYSCSDSGCTFSMEDCEVNIPVSTFTTGKEYSVSVKGSAYTYLTSYTSTANYTITFTCDSDVKAVLYKIDSADTKSTLFTSTSTSRTGTVTLAPKNQYFIKITGPSSSTRTVKFKLSTAVTYNTAAMDTWKSVSMKNAGDKRYYRFTIDGYTMPDEDDMVDPICGLEIQYQGDMSKIRTNIYPEQKREDDYDYDEFHTKKTGGLKTADIYKNGTYIMEFVANTDYVANSFKFKLNTFDIVEGLEAIPETITDITLPYDNTITATSSSALKFTIDHAAMLKVLDELGEYYQFSIYQDTQRGMIRLEYEYEYEEVTYVEIQPGTYYITVDGLYDDESITGRLAISEVPACTNGVHADSIEESTMISQPDMLLVTYRCDDCMRSIQKEERHAAEFSTSGWVQEDEKLYLTYDYYIDDLGTNVSYYQEIQGNLYEKKYLTLPLQTATVTDNTYLYLRDVVPGRYTMHVETTMPVSVKGCDLEGMYDTDDMEQDAFGSWVEKGTVMDHTFDIPYTDATEYLVIIAPENKTNPYSVKITFTKEKEYKDDNEEHNFTESDEYLSLESGEMCKSYFCEQCGTTMDECFYSISDVAEWYDMNSFYFVTRQIDSDYAFISFEVSSDCMVNLLHYNEGWNCLPEFMRLYKQLDDESLELAGESEVLDDVVRLRAYCTKGIYFLQLKFKNPEDLYLDGSLFDDHLCEIRGHSYDVLEHSYDETTQILYERKVCYRCGDYQVIQSFHEHTFNYYSTRYSWNENTQNLTRSIPCIDCSEIFIEDVTDSLNSTVPLTINDPVTDNSEEAGQCLVYSFESETDEPVYFHLKYPYYYVNVLLLKKEGNYFTQKVNKSFWFDESPLLLQEPGTYYLILNPAYSSSLEFLVYDMNYQEQAVTLTTDQNRLSASYRLPSLDDIIEFGILLSDQPVEELTLDTPGRIRLVSADMSPCMIFDPEDQKYAAARAYIIYFDKAGKIATLYSE